MGSAPRGNEFIAQWQATCVGSEELVVSNTMRSVITIDGFPERDKVHSATASDQGERRLG